MPRIKFADVSFPDHNIPSGYDIEVRLKKFLDRFREQIGSPKFDYALSDSDRLKIKRRSAAYLSAVSRRSGMDHLDPKDRARLEVFRNGAQVQPVETEHRADEIASCLHTEMPWMAPATERLLHEMRASVRNGDPAPLVRPMLLVGPPGIGKSHWSRLLGAQLSVPTTIIEATGEPAAFAVTGSQKGWGSAGPGRVLEAIMASQIANPVVVVDEIEKAGPAVSTKGQSYDLSQGLLPLLERLTAQSWSCPYYRVPFDMSWITWILTANSVNGLSAPFLSRCPPMQLSSLSMNHLISFADREGVRRQLPHDAIDAVKEVIEAIQAPHLVEQNINRPLLH